LGNISGAEIIFRSFLEPMVGRYFKQGTTASGLRAKVDTHTE
jgi:receptor expression-enhancing protein 5/6